MDRVVELLERFAEQNGGPPPDRQAFIGWQVEHGGVPNRNTASANCYPLAAKEFDLFGASPARYRGFVAGGPAGLAAVVGARVPAADERELVCLIDCCLAGMLAGHSREERLEWLRSRGVAPTVAGADTLVHVGRSVGRHFGLIDRNGRPTPEFDAYFRGAPWPEYRDAIA